MKTIYDIDYINDNEKNATREEWLAKMAGHDPDNWEEKDDINEGDGALFAAVIFLIICFIAFLYLAGTLVGG